MNSIESVKTSRELAAELAAARKRELETAKQDLVTRFQNEIAGRSFVWRYDGRDNQRAIGYISYGKKVTLDTWRGENETPQVKIEQRTVLALTSPSRKHAFEVASLKCDRREETHEYVETAKQRISHEVPNAAFESVWQAVNSMTGAALALWSDAANLPLTSPTDTSKDEMLDVPHVLLEHGEANIVTGPFLVTDTIYLLTPNSLSYARAKIAEAQATDSRCSHLYEACDMGYVTRNRETIAKLRAKLGI